MLTFTPKNNLANCIESKSHFFLHVQLSICCFESNIVNSESVIKDVCEHIVLLIKLIIKMSVLK